MGEVVILGSGAGFATRKRFNTSIALLCGGHAYILDCGEPCGALVYRNGIDPVSIRGIFISHMHPDHVGGLPQLLFSILLPARSREVQHRSWSIKTTDGWYREHLTFPPPDVRQKSTGEKSGKRFPISLMVPEEAVEPLKAFFPSVYLMDEALPFDLSILPIRQDGQEEFYRDENIQVSAHPNSHLLQTKLYDNIAEKHFHVKRESYSFIVQAEGKRILYSGDIQALDELAELLDGISLMILEVAHFSPEEIMAFVERRDVERIVLTHIHPGLEERVEDVLAHSSDKRVILAHDGLRVAL